MTSSRFTAESETAPGFGGIAGQTQPFALPLVSVVIVNYNYGRFLLDAVRSVRAQTYKRIELIIVDDASTDESAGVLDTVASLYPETRIVRLPENKGQSLATRAGFEQSTGDYVVFLDADDVLLKNFIATHIFVHLSLRIPVGFTSSDMAQASTGRIITGSLQYFSDYIRSGKGKRADLIRRVDVEAPELWTLPVAVDEIRDHVHWVEPSYFEQWIWAPTSGNCFRRDALALVLDNDALAQLRSCTDAYLLRVIAVLTGSVLIDRPLSIYRVHGANVFTQMAHLNGILSYDRKTPNNNDQKARRLAIDFLVAKADVLGPRMPMPFDLLRALKTLDASWPRMPSDVSGCRSYTGAEIIKHFSKVVEGVRLPPLVAYSPKLGISAWRLLWTLITSPARRR